MLLSSPLVTPRQNIVNFFWLFLNLFYSVFFTKLSKIRLLIAKSFNTQSSLNILSSHDLQLFLSNHKAFSCPMCDPRHPVEETYFRHPILTLLFEACDFRSGLIGKSSPGSAYSSPGGGVFTNTPNNQLLKRSSSWWVIKNIFESTSEQGKNRNTLFLRSYL